jgi:hypothetical protein
VAILERLQHLFGVVPDCVLVELNSGRDYLVLHLGEEALLVGVLEDHAEGVVVLEAAVHLQDVWVVHVELQLDLLRQLGLHPFLPNLD